MKEQKHYFSLKPKGGNAFHEKGKRLKLTERIVNIGETPDCDVRYEHHGLQPEYYASIIRNDDGKSWRIVRRSQFVEVSISGKGSIGYASQLEDGDIIHFTTNGHGQEQADCDMALLFHTHNDDRYGEDDEKDTSWQWMTAALLTLVALVAVVLLLNDRQETVSAQDVEPLEESVYVVKVDSVEWLLHTHNGDSLLMPAKVLAGETPTGTAFLTTDGRIVTARHCVEYWIGQHIDLTMRVDALPCDDIIRWAIETETFNQTHETDSVMLLRVSFSIHDFMGNECHAFTTADSRVHINTSRDGVLMLADFNHDYYWRTIRPFFTYREMELGDILWIDSIGEKGKVALAGKEEMKKVKNGTRLMICGYPLTGIGDKRMTFTEGTIRRSVSTEEENLFFESNINHGFSGGPVLMKTGGRVVAIGVVSRVDSVSSGLYKWAVPVTAIDN